VVTRKESHHRISIVLQYSKERYGDCHTGSPVSRLHHDPRGIGIEEILSVKCLVGLCHNEHGSILAKERTEAFSRVIQQAFVTENTAELVWP
jgi:hypothetical protein